MFEVYVAIVYLFKSYSAAPIRPSKQLCELYILVFCFDKYCDVYAVGLRSRRCLVTTRHGTLDISLEKVSSLWSVPRLYNEDHESKETKVGRVYFTNFDEVLSYILTND
jgi:hypothetical protein